MEDFGRVFACVIVPLFFGFLAFTRYLNYRETVVLAEKGLARPGRIMREDSKDTLRWGIAITAIGMALCVGLFPIGLSSTVVDQYPLGLGPWMLVGLLPTFFGLGLILIYVLTREEKKPEKEAEQKPEEPPSAE